MARIIVATLLFGLPALSFADFTVGGDTSSRVPEPETLALLAGAAVAWGIVRWIRRK